MIVQIHKKHRSFFHFLTWIGVFFCLGAGQTGCYPTSNLYVQEYDEVYATKEDIEAEEDRRATIESLPTDSVEQLKPPRAERRRMDPETKELILYIVGGIGEMLLNAVLIYLFYF